MTQITTLANLVTRYVLAVVLCIGLKRHPRHAVAGGVPVREGNSTVIATQCACTQTSRLMVAVVG